MQTCRHCGAALIEKKTKRTPAQLLKQYYYTAYYFCPQCHRIYHNDKFKVVNQNHSLFTQNSHEPEDIEVEIWTDGACSNNGTPRAKAAWAFVSGKYEENGLVEGAKQTNNVAEGLGIYYGLLWAGKKGYKKIRLHTDSQISINNLRKSVDEIKENRDIFKKIFDTIHEYGLHVSFQKVAGHSGDINNERADRLANGLVGIK
jgi:ribonuclease HI